MAERVNIMGTNYYLLTDICPHCGKEKERIHIGKSSAGWCFALHVIPGLNLNSLEDWRVRFSVLSNIIVDEYEHIISVEEMLHIITEREHPTRDCFPYKNWTCFHFHNDSEFGPNGLVRSKISSRCIGHGEGTWDLITGEFS